MTTPAPFGARLTVEALAPVIDGTRRPAGQPLGTWMSRWATVYTDPDLPDGAAVPTARPGTAPRSLPRAAA